MHDNQKLPTNANPWIVRYARRPQAKLRLFCIPHAGGSAVVFRNWSSWLSDRIEVCAVQLPGHGHRVREPGEHDFEVLAQRLVEGLLGEIDRPYALFGHSMGALLAFEVARRFAALGCGEPLHLFISGHNTPQRPHTLDGILRMDDAALTEQLRHMGATPPQILQNDELMRLVLPMIRADFAACASYRYRAAAPLRCPMTVLGGSDDPHCDAAGLEAWHEETAGPCRVWRMPGDHFYLTVATQSLVELIGRELAVSLERCG